MAKFIKSLRSYLSVGRGLHKTPRLSLESDVLPEYFITGKELWEYKETYELGNKDPYLILPRKRGPGTKDCPNVIPSYTESRVIGCICNDEVFHIKFFTLYDCFPRRCECNYWFVLERLEQTPPCQPCCCKNM